jgi:hypothetical protein
VTFSLPEPFPVETVPGGTSCLLAGPPLTRKRELLLRLLGGDADTEATVVVTSRRGASSLAAEFRERNGDRPPERFHIVDCVTVERALGEVREDDTTSYVSSPRDLTGLSIELSGVSKELYDSGVPTRVGMHSLSTFLMYHDLSSVYRLLHILTGQIESADWFGVFVVDSPDDRELGLMSQLVDGVIETRETETGTDLRVRGLGTDDRSWRPY